MKTISLVIATLLFVSRDFTFCILGYCEVGFFENLISNKTGNANQRLSTKVLSMYFFLQEKFM